jgi:hypothetical protein
MLEDDQRRFDFSRGAQLAALRALRLPDGIPRSGSKVRASTLLAVLRVIDDRAGKNGAQWWDQATLGKQAGISSRTVSKAMQVLESMNLIEKIDTRRGGARRLVVSINWQTVFADREPFQDPTILESWGLLEPALDDGFNSELDVFNSELSSEFNSERGSQLIRNGVPNSLLNKSTRNPLTLDEGGGAGESFEDFESTETGSYEYSERTQQHRSCIVIENGSAELCLTPAGRTHKDRLGAGEIDGSGLPGRNQEAIPARSQRDRQKYHQPSAISYEPSTMPTRTIDPRERELIKRLVDLGVGSAAATLREALRIGYSCEAVVAVLDWFEAETLTDPETGERVRPYHAGQLVTRLRDEYATDTRPDCGKWGGRRGEWTALKARLSDPKPSAGRVPDLSMSRRAAVVEGLSRAQVVFCLEVLASGDGPDVPRAVKCLAWVETNWLSTENRLIPPTNVIKFLMQFRIEEILWEFRS